MDGLERWRSCSECSHASFTAVYAAQCTRFRNFSRELMKVLGWGTQGRSEGRPLESLQSADKREGDSGSRTYKHTSSNSHHETPLHTVCRPLPQPNSPSRRSYRTVFQLTCSNDDLEHAKLRCKQGHRPEGRLVQEEKFQRRNWKSLLKTLVCAH